MSLELFPEAPVDAATVARMEDWAAQLRQHLADYRQYKGKPGCSFRRGFVGDITQSLRRVERWLKTARATLAKEHNRV